MNNFNSRSISIYDNIINYEQRNYVEEGGEKMKSIKKIKMGVILLVGIIVSIFTIKMV